VMTAMRPWVSYFTMSDMVPTVVARRAG